MVAFVVGIGGPPLPLSMVVFDATNPAPLAHSLVDPGESLDLAYRADLRFGISEVSKPGQMIALLSAAA